MVLYHGTTSEEHRHSAIRCVTQGQRHRHRHRGEDNDLLEQRRVVYESDRLTNGATAFQSLENLPESSIGMS